jgi:hypothetical protein
MPGDQASHPREAPEQLGLALWDAPENHNVAALLLSEEWTDADMTIGQVSGGSV